MIGHYNLEVKKILQKNESRLAQMVKVKKYF